MWVVQDSEPVALIITVLRSSACIRLPAMRRLQQTALKLMLPTTHLAAVLCTAWIN